MSSNTLTIKPNNHRIYQCPFDKKLELLNKLIEDNSKASIVVVTAKDAKNIEENLVNKDIKVLEDKELIKDKELRAEIIIGFDMPIKNIVYMARAGKATERSFMLLDESEQNELHFIERLLGRAIKQERVEGFEYPVIKREESAVKKLSKDQIKEVAKQRYESSTQEKPKREFNDKKPSDSKWDKKKKAPNKFLGKDENGKAIFSGKSGERNHRYDGTARERYDAPKVTGKKINIKARKPKSED
ncbi:hypothetical protein [Sulfurimonas sp.]